MSCVVYYLGGPWDLHKVATPRVPQGDREIIRVAKPSYSAKPIDAVEVVEHTYALQRVAHDVFVALHEEPQKQ